MSEAADKQALLQRIIAARKAGLAEPVAAPPVQPDEETPESHYRVEKFPRTIQLRLHRELAGTVALGNPFFPLHEDVGRDTAVIGGKSYINFCTYNYLGLNGDIRVNQAAQEAAEKFGTSASASRLVGGERPPHRELERALARLHGAEDALTFVSGFGTNLSIIATLMGADDLVIMDRSIHNSIVQGARLSGATIQSFPHNDWEALDRQLTAVRRRFERVLIAVEGIYSMEGDVCPLDRIVEIKQRHKALLMVDEAHSIGALGKTGRGAGEYFDIPSAAVDVWMGTLSKTLASCGGYAAGSAALIDLLRFTAPGFVYSVGMPPPVAAAANKALSLMLEEPERIEKLHKNAAYFLARARAAGLNTGASAGLNIVPVIVGPSLLTANLSVALYGAGIHVSPIVFPAVEEQSARLRFFLSCDHSYAQLDIAIQGVTAAMVSLAGP